MTEHIGFLLDHRDLRRGLGQRSFDEGIRVLKVLLGSSSGRIGNGVDLLMSPIFESRYDAMEAGRGTDRGSTPGPPRIASSIWGEGAKSRILRSNSLMV